MARTTFDDPGVQALLAARDVAVLSTLQKNGAPVSIAMWYVHDDRRITMISQQHSQKVRNIERDPRVSVAVELEDAGALSCVSIQGRAEFMADPQLRQPLVEQLFDRYAAALEGRWSGRRMPADRVMFRIVPEIVFVWGAPPGQMK